MTQLGRFDQHPDKPYGTCLTCGVEVADEVACRVHVKGTEKPESRFHRVQVSNPTRPERIRQALSDMVDAALNDFVFAAQGLVYNKHATMEEISEAMNWQADDFNGAWMDAVEDDQ